MAGSRTSSATELLLPAFDRDGGEPLHRQLERSLREAVRSRRLAPNSTVPSTRALAGELGLARGVVVEAYEQLIAEGYLAARPGGATRVARVPLADAGASLGDTARPQFEFDFRPGRPELAEFPRAAWLRSIRRVLNEAPAARLGYLDGRGIPELRGALADYLNRVRGTSASLETTVISTGFAQGLQVAALALRANGVRRIAVEDPWHSEYRDMLISTGLMVVDIPVDEDGLRIELLPAADVRAVVVTPAHQYPTGAVLSPQRRVALIDWADRVGGTIIEDDYDSEFRYDREPIGAIQGMCRDRVVFAGTASKVLAPGLRLGWLVAPPRLVDAIASVKLKADHGSAAIDQLAFADFLQHGELDRHLRRMRPVYRQRRDRLLESLTRHMPAVQPVGASAGLHLLVWLPDGVDTGRLVRDAAGQGVGVDQLTARTFARAGLILGYGGITEARIEEGVERLAAVAAADHERLSEMPLPRHRA